MYQEFVLVCVRSAILHTAPWSSVFAFCKDIYEKHDKVMYLLTGHCEEERSEKSLDISLFHEHSWR